MKKIFYFPFLVLLILSSCTREGTEPIASTTSPAEEVILQPTNQPEPAPFLQRGVNMGNMLEAPNEGEWGLYVEEEYFDLIKEAGFDFVRLPVVIQLNRLFSHELMK
jgi:endoglucanase